MGSELPACGARWWTAKPPADQVAGARTLREEALVTAKGLFNSTVQRAFRGKLGCGAVGGAGSTGAAV